MRATIQDERGSLVGLIDAEPKEFKTGSKGYFGTGKVSVNGRRYQCQLQMVEIKPKQPEPKPELKEKVKSKS